MTSKRGLKRGPIFSTSWLFICPLDQRRTEKRQLVSHAALKTKSLSFPEEVGCSVYESLNFLRQGVQEGKEVSEHDTLAGSTFLILSLSDRERKSLGSNIMYLKSQYLLFDNEPQNFHAYRITQGVQKSIPLPIKYFFSS